MATEEEMESYLTEALWVDGKVESVRTYESAGLLTGNLGLVVNFTTGDIFHFTIVQEKASDEELVWEWEE